MLLFPMTTIGLFSENKLFWPLSQSRRNYPKIARSDGSGSATAADVEESTGYKAMLQSTLVLIKH